MREATKHIKHYLPLLGIFTVGFFGFAYFSYDRLFQGSIVVSVAIAYVVWGIIHHALHKDLYLEVVIEYILIALLCVTAVFVVLFRA